MHFTFSSKVWSLLRVFDVDGLIHFSSERLCKVLTGSSKWRVPKAIKTSFEEDAQFC